MNAIKNIIERASKLNGTVVLPEGQDPRVITAACACVDRKIATPVVLGTPEEISAAEEKAGLKLADRGIKEIDYTKGDAELEKAYLEAWNAKESKKPAEKQKIIDLAAAAKTGFASSTAFCIFSTSSPPALPFVENERKATRGSLPVRSR